MGWNVGDIGIAFDLAFLDRAAGWRSLPMLSKSRFLSDAEGSLSLETKGGNLRP
jgi:hypothetical protein